MPIPQLDAGALASLAQVYLVPSTILVGALGAARTEGLKTGISVLGMITTAVWIYGMGSVDANSGLGSVKEGVERLAWVFGVVWVTSFGVHLSEWQLALIKPKVERLRERARQATSGQKDDALPKANFPEEVISRFGELVHAGALRERLIEHGRQTGQYSAANDRPRRMFIYWRLLSASDKSL